MSTELANWCDVTNVHDHVCRLCFQLTDLTISIFEAEGLEQNLPAKVKHLPVNITESDVLPKQLCYKCADILVNWDNLVTTCVESDKKLRTYFGLSHEMNKNDKVDDSDDEPLMPPKKRKLQEIKQSTGSKALKSRRKKGTPKKLKKQKTDLVKVKEEVSGGGGETQPETAAALLTEFKAEMCEEDTSEVFNLLGRDESDREEEEEVEDEEDSEGSIKCEQCGKRYKQRISLDRHMKQVHGGGDRKEGHVCHVCGHVYKTAGNLERHHTKEHLNNQVECQVCHASVNAKKLEAHLRTVHGVKGEGDQVDRFKCKVCDKWFRNKYARNSHVKEAHLSQTVKCKLCDFEGLRQVVRRHRRDVHAEKRFPCSLCENAFKTLHTLKMHMTSHSDLRCYTCDVCGMGFKRLNNVRDHMKCHEEKSNQCQICGNFFVRKRYLAIHQKTIHNFYADGVVPEEKGFECGTCGAKLKWKKNLLAHMRIHTGEKPYVCKICKKDFICHGSLRTHMSKHDVCTATEKTVDAMLSPVSVAVDELHDPQAHLQLEMSVFNHFPH